MNFSRAFRYPFRNFAKVMSIVLALTIAFAVFIAMILNSHDWSPLLAGIYGLDHPDSFAETMQPVGGTTIIGILGLLLVAIASGFWLSGYSIEVIRGVMREDEWMPAVELSRNLKDGACLFASSVAYWALLCLLLVALALANGIFGRIGFLGGLVAFASVIVAVAAAALMGWAYFVGMARFAAEGDYKASWRIRENMRIARVNWRKGLKLLLYSVALSVIYGVVRSVVEGVFGGLLGADLLAGITLSIIIYYMFNLMQHFSTQVLIAQYAIAIGIRSDHYRPEKDKEKGKVGF